MKNIARLLYRFLLIAWERGRAAPERLLLAVGTPPDGITRTRSRQLNRSPGSILGDECQRKKLVWETRPLELCLPREIRHGQSVLGWLWAAT